MGNTERSSAVTTTIPHLPRVSFKRLFTCPQRWNVALSQQAHFFGRSSILRSTTGTFRATMDMMSSLSIGLKPASLVTATITITT